MSTASQVFATTELLEAILLELPGHDILRSQRVSRQWQATIIGSPKLQQALFMLASPKPEDEPAKRVNNLFLQSLFRRKYFVRENKWKRPVTGLRFHDLVIREGSWKDMHWCSPPATRIKGQYSAFNNRGKQFFVCNTQGVKMGDFACEIERLTGEPVLECKLVFWIHGMESWKIPKSWKVPEVADGEDRPRMGDLEGPLEGPLEGASGAGDEAAEPSSPAMGLEAVSGQEEAVTEWE